MTSLAELQAKLKTLKAQHFRSECVDARYASSGRMGRALDQIKKLEQQLGVTDQNTTKTCE